LPPRGAPLSKVKKPSFFAGFFRGVCKQGFEGPAWKTGVADWRGNPRKIYRERMVSQHQTAFLLNLGPAGAPKAQSRARRKKM